LSTATLAVLTGSFFFGGILSFLSLSPLTKLERRDRTTPAPTKFRKCLETGGPISFSCGYNWSYTCASTWAPPPPMTTNEGSTRTPPFVSVKNEEAVNQPEPAQTRPSGLSASPFPTAAGEALPEIDLPPRFKAIFESVLQSRPDLVQTRYSQFLNAETKVGDAIVQDADQVKLFSLFLLWLTLRTRIHIPAWAAAYIRAGRE
jgi:hypothetical protein